MSAQVFADKWEWLSKQSNWKRILHESGITKIKKDWSVEQAIYEIRKEHPHTFLPWNDEGNRIKRLEEIIERKTSLAKSCKDLSDTLEQLNDQLAKENEELKREIKELRFPDGC